MSSYIFVIHYNLFFRSHRIPFLQGSQKTQHKEQAIRKKKVLGPPLMKSARITIAFLKISFSLLISLYELLDRQPGAAEDGERSFGIVQNMQVKHYFCFQLG